MRRRQAVRWTSGDRLIACAQVAMAVRLPGADDALSPDRFCPDGLTAPMSAPGARVPRLRGRGFRRREIRRETPCRGDGPARGRRRSRPIPGTGLGERTGVAAGHEPRMRRDLVAWKRAGETRAGETREGKGRSLSVPGDGAREDCGARAGRDVGPGGAPGSPPSAQGRIVRQATQDHLRLDRSRLGARSGSSSPTRGRRQEP